MQEKESLADSTTNGSKNIEFSLAADNGDFTNRCRDVFSCLQTLEDKHVAHDKSADSLENSPLLKRDPTEEETEVLTRQFKKPNLPPTTEGHSQSWSGRQSDKRGIKRPSTELYVPPWQRSGGISPSSDFQARQTKISKVGQSFPERHKKKVPDFKVNPHKWQKYSLEDVEDMSQSSNSKAAFAFLEERRKLREAAEGKEEESHADVEGVACSRGKIVFKKPPKKGGNQDAETKVTKSTKDNSEMNFNQEDASRDFDNEEEEEELVIKPNVTFKSKKTKGSRNIRKKISDDD